MNKLKEIFINNRFIITVLAVGAILRLLFLTKEGLWHDEALTGISAVKPFWQMISFQFYLGHTPLYLLIIKPLVFIFGDSELVLRLPSVIFGVLAVYALFLLADKLFKNKLMVYTSTALFALSALQIHFSQEARPYTMLVFFVILSFYLLLKALEDESVKSWFLYSIATLVAIYISASALPVLAVQFVYSLIKKRGSFRFNTSLVAIAFIYAPMFFYYFIRGSYKMRWFTPLNMKTFTNLFYGYLLLPIPILEEVGIAGFYSVVMKLLSFLLLIPLAYGIYSVWKKRKEEDSSSVLLLWLWIIVPILIELIYSLSIRPILGYKRYIIAFSPPLYLLLSHGLWEMSPKTIKKAACIALIVLFSIPLFSYYSMIKNEDWRGAIRYVSENVSLGDPVFTDYLGIPMFEYYWKGRPVRLFDVWNLYSFDFKTGWLILRDDRFNDNFGDGSKLRKDFKISDVEGFIDIKLIKLER